MWVPARKPVDVRYETPGLGTLPVEAEIAHGNLTSAAHVRGEGIEGLAPRFEQRVVQVRFTSSDDEVPHRMQGTLLVAVLTP
jgi:hypothetical protein